MIADSTDTGYDSFGASAYPQDPNDSLDAVQSPGVAPAPYSEEFGGGGSPFDQPVVSDSTFQPQLADTPNPDTGIPGWIIAAGIGLAFLLLGEGHE